MKEKSLWHEVTNKEKEDIKKDVRHLLNEFASKLERTKYPKLNPKKAGELRSEGSGWKTDQDFRDLMFLNAPFVEDNLIIAEKGKWKK